MRPVIIDGWPACIDSVHVAVPSNPGEVETVIDPILREEDIPDGDRQIRQGTCTGAQREASEVLVDGLVSRLRGGINNFRPANRKRGDTVSRRGQAVLQHHPDTGRGTTAFLPVGSAQGNTKTVNRVTISIP